MAFKRLPNGFGSIVKRSENLRKPYRARKLIRYECDEQTGKARAIYYNIGNFATRNEALKALMDFKGPQLDETSPVTLLQCYEGSGNAEKEISESLKCNYKRGFEMFRCLWNRPIADLKVGDYEQAIKNSGAAPSTYRFARMTLSMAYRYAMKHDHVHKDVSALVNFSVKYTKKKKTSLTVEEVNELWNKEGIIRDMILFGCYSGFRPGEVVLITIDNINDGFITGGIKTEAGTNRKVPIHHSIKEIVQRNIDRSRSLGSVRLFCQDSGDIMRQYQYAAQFKKILPNHTSHETRHTFATFARKNDLDPLVVKWILGHSSFDITEKVYTHKQLDKLATEMEKFKIE